MAAGTAWVALGGALASTLGCESTERTRAAASPDRAGHAWSFRSRPDLSPPLVDVEMQAHDTALGYLFVGP